MNTYLLHNFDLFFSNLFNNCLCFTHAFHLKVMLLTIFVVIYRLVCLQSLTNFKMGKNRSVFRSSKAKWQAIFSGASSMLNASTRISSEESKKYTVEY